MNIITREDIEQLRRDALEFGDRETDARCVRALSGDQEAWDECAAFLALSRETCENVIAEIKAAFLDEGKR